MRKKVTVICAALLVLAVAAAAFAGCGGGGGEQLPKRSLPSDASAEMILVESVKATNDVRTVRYDLSMVLNVPPTQQQTQITTIDLNGQADLDVANARAKGMLTWGNVSIDFVLVGGTRFYKSSTDSTWFSMPEGEDFQLPDISSLVRNANEYLKNYKSIEQLADEEIAGRPCFHLRLTPDLMSMLDQPGVADLLNLTGTGEDGQPLDITTLREQLKDATAQVDYWVDKDYLVVRKNVIGWELKTNPGTNQAISNIKANYEMVFNAYNIEMDIQPPTSSEPASEQAP